MNAHELLQLLAHPEQMTLSQVYELENIVHKYPYFQAGRAIHLKVLYAQKSYRYNQALKQTAAHIGNRTALFHLITSPYFKKSIPSLEQELAKMPHTDYKEALPEEFSAYVLDDVFEQVSPKEHQPKEQIADFSPDEQEQFNEFFTIDKTPIDREQMLQEQIQVQIQNKTQQQEAQEVSPLPEDLPNEVAKKFSLIDKFLEANPKIEVRKDYPEHLPLQQPKEREIMTETLAKIYVEQAKYDEAIRAYSILMMKNPERTRYFAEQISYIKELKQINKED